MRSLWLAPPVLLGAALRLWNLRNQVLADDELHLVRTALTRPVGEILTTYQKVDATIPLSALYRALVEGGVRLTEMNVRLPALLSGLALLVLAPLWAERRLGGRTAVAFAWLLALSPGLVLYSRIARSYMPVVLLSFGAAVAFESWWRNGGWRRGAAYAGLAALAFWFHPVAAPLVLSPLVFGLIADRGRALSLAGLGAAAGAAILAFLLPALSSFQEVIRAKQREVDLTREVWGAVAQLQAGTGVALLAGLFWLGAGFGLLRLLQEDRSLGGLTGVLVAGQLAGLLWISPLGLDEPLIFHRYALVALPWVLLWAAVALGRISRSALAALPVAVLFASGPLADASLWRSAFPHHDDRLAFYVRRPRRPEVPLPPVYRQLGPGAVAEAPWIPVWRVSRAVALYQEAHGREVVLATPEPLLADQRLAFRNLVPATPGALLASRARWLVVHRDLAAEEEAIPDPLPRLGVGRRFREVFRSQGSALPRQLRRAWGRPDFADATAVAWDLDRVRQRSPPEVRRSRQGVLRSPPGLQRSPHGLLRSPPVVQRSPPGVQRSPPGVQRSPPGVQRSPQGLRRSPQDVRRSPQESQRSRPDLQRSRPDHGAGRGMVCSLRS